MRLNIQKRLVTLKQALAQYARYVELVAPICHKWTLYKSPAQWPAMPFVKFLEFSCLEVNWDAVE